MSRRANDWLFASLKRIKMIKLNKVTFKQAEAAVHNIHRKIPVLESLFNKETPIQVLSCKYGKMFKTSFFYRTHPFADSQHSIFLHDSPAICSVILHFAPL